MDVDTVPPPMTLNMPSAELPTVRSPVLFQSAAPVPPPTVTVPVENTPIDAVVFETMPPPVMLSEPLPKLPMRRPAELVQVELPVPPPTVTVPMLPDMAPILPTPFE